MPQLKFRHLLLLPMAACHDITAPADPGCTITSHLIVDGRPYNLTACYRVCPSDAEALARTNAQTVEHVKCAA